MASRRHQRGNTPDRMVAVRVFEAAKDGGRAAAHSAHPTAKLTLREARVLIERFVEDGYIALVRRADGSGDIDRSTGTLPPDVRAIVLFRANRGQ